MIYVLLKTTTKSKLKNFKKVINYLNPFVMINIKTLLRLSFFILFFNLSFSQTTKAIIGAVKKTSKQINSSEPKAFTENAADDNKMAAKKQKFFVSGVVMDKTTLETIAGAKVLIKELNKTVVTDFDGSFKIEVPVTEKITVLIASHDMKTYEIISENNDRFDVEFGKIYLQPDNSNEKIYSKQRL